MKCNICGHDQFGDMNSRKNIKCLKCGSLERTRLLFMYLQKINITKDTKILHFAPEKGLYDYLYKIAANNYHTADFDPNRYNKFAKNIKKIDLSDDIEQIRSNYYDIVIHVHILEHIPCNIAYTLFHLHRILKPDGLHICCIPFMNGKYDECFQDITDEERTVRFGQFDHVRRFGKQDIHMTLGKIINLPDTFNALNDFDKTELIENNIPENCWHGFTANTILFLKKNDYKLGSTDIV